ncbi:MAG: type III PLP-dependent enzyme [Pseudomonadota bacterium]
MTPLSRALFSQPSLLSTDFDQLGLPAFRTVSDALASDTSDDAFAVLYPATLRATAMAFLDGFPGTTLYAVKANPHPAVLSILWSAGVRDFDVASIREIDLVRSLCPDARLHLMHPVKSRQTIWHAYASGVRDFAFDCLGELEKILRETGGAPDLHLHIRIAVPCGESRMPLEGKFGAQFGEGIRLIEVARNKAARLGVAFHVGSQCVDPLAYIFPLEQIRRLIDEASLPIDIIDCGGGFPVSYPGMRSPPISAFFSVISETLSRLGLDHLEVRGEPGRALSGPAGSTLARVDLRKGSELYINDGIYGSLFDAGVHGWRYPVKRHRLEADQSFDEEISAFGLYGPTCDSQDRMAGPFLLPNDIDEGDWIEFGHLGAYGQAMQSGFNGFRVEKTVAVFGETFGHDDLSQA